MRSDTFIFPIEQTANQNSYSFDSTSMVLKRVEVLSGSGVRGFHFFDLQKDLSGIIINAELFLRTGNADGRNLSP